MSATTSIEWAEATWNPVRGCTKVSPGCTRCYAERFAERFRGVKGHPYEHGFDLKLAPDVLGEPLRWTNPKRIFVCSMSDLFHKDVPDKYLRQVTAVMLKATWHNFLILTKRPLRMNSFVMRHHALASADHVWFGASVEDKTHGLPRIDQLRDNNVRHRFLSIEPLLEDLGQLDLHGIHWVIVGGESGPGARPMKAEWVRSIRDQCEQASIPFFFKQWGGPIKGRTGRTLDDVTHNDVPRFALPMTASREERRIALTSLSR